MTAKGALRWPQLVWRMRREAVSLAARALKQLPAAPAVAGQALLCIPRVLEIVAEIDASGSEVVHLFWARHAGLVLPALQMAGAAPLRSAFVGAYDLTADDFLVDVSLGSAQILFSHAETNRAYVEAKAPGNAEIRIVHRGIPLPPLETEDVRDPDLWVTASALVRDKNVEAVLRAFAQARARHRSLRLEVFGDGPDRQRLELVASELGCSDAVHFHGHASRATLFARLQTASLFLLLSTKASERLPNVVKEALWAGCQVIASNSAGIEELIPGPEVAMVVDPNDAASLAQAVDQALAISPAAEEQRRAYARRWIKERFSSEQSMARYVAAWREARRANSLPAFMENKKPADPRSRAPAMNRVTS
jgi:glycosyltransferase involved in cell wall biosynthesis